MIKLLTTAALLTMSITMTAANETIVLRIKGMRCEECAHKVTTVLRQLEGIEGVSFDLEKRTATVEFDASKTCTDSIKGRLAATGRYKSSPYSPADVINRGMGLQMSDMHCQKCADRIVSRLSTIDGVDSLAPHLDKHYVFVRYDANKTCKAEIRQALNELGFTPVNYYTSKNISFAYFNISEEAATEATIEEVMALDGVDDANVNPKIGALAITYVNTETTEQKLLEAVKAAGIEATVPAPHERKEGMEKAE
jgi:copper ion binding protein